MNSGIWFSERGKPAMKLIAEWNEWSNWLSGLAESGKRMELDYKIVCSISTQSTQFTSWMQASESVVSSAGKFKLKWSWRRRKCSKHITHIKFTCILLPAASLIASFYFSNSLASPAGFISIFISCMKLKFKCSCAAPTRFHSFLFHSIHSWNKNKFRSPIQPPHKFHCTPSFRFVQFIAWLG